MMHFMDTTASSIYLGEAENVVYEEQHILSLVTEVLSHRQTCRFCDASKTLFLQNELSSNSILATVEGNFNTRTKVKVKA